MTFPCVKLTNTKIQIQKIQIQNTQIQHMTKCQKDPTCVIFKHQGLFKDVKNNIFMGRTHNFKIQIHKYKNTAYDEVPERLNMWYIFEKRIVQGYQTLYSHTIQT